VTKLIAPKLRVTVEAAGGAGANEYDVQSDNRDVIRWERAAHKHGWPALRDAPVLWMTHLAYTALSRSGVDVGGGFEAFEGRVIAIETLDADGQPADPADPDALGAGADPTNGDPASASVSSSH